MSRLVIRIKLPPREPTPAPERPRLRKGALLLIAGAVAVALALVGIYMLRTEPAPAPASSNVAPPVNSQPAAPPAPETVEAQPVEAKPAAPPAPVSEVTPDVPQRALNTISGTIRVTIRAIVDKEGKVLDATVQERGASRYFARLALEASRKWTFAPSTSQEQRVTQIRFYFKRGGVTARASQSSSP
jgi:TonB family protein